MSQNDFFKKVLNYELIIPQFNLFTQNVEKIYEEIKADPTMMGGTMATYIPPLAMANPEWFATGFCSADG